MMNYWYKALHNHLLILDGRTRKASTFQRVNWLKKICENYIPYNYVIVMELYATCNNTIVKIITLTIMQLEIVALRSDKISKNVL